ncbi:MAG: hypothetical protein HDQ88_09580, partial [Clostridia bacterium]|nr:hypothetical protein [Clostridia bacterium]
IAIGKEEAVKTRINANLQAMYELQLHMDEYEMRVSNNGVVVPDAPLPIRNDVVNAPDENGYYSLTTDFVYNRGFDFDWANGSVRQGWLSDICPEGNYAVFFREHGKLTEDTPFSLSDGTVKWYYLDGTTVDLNANDDIDGSAQTRKSINDLKQLWSAFNDLKTEYQIDLLQELLMLEVDARSIERNYSVAADMPITLY